MALPLPLLPTTQQQSGHPAPLPLLPTTQQQSGHPAAEEHVRHSRTAAHPAVTARQVCTVSAPDLDKVGLLASQQVDHFDRPISGVAAASTVVGGLQAPGIAKTSNHVALVLEAGEVGESEARESSHLPDIGTSSATQVRRGLGVKGEEEEEVVEEEEEQLQDSRTHHSEGWGRTARQEAVEEAIDAKPAHPNAPAHRLRADHQHRSLETTSHQSATIDPAAVLAEVVALEVAAVPCCSTCGWAQGSFLTKGSSCSILILGALAQDRSGLVCLSYTDCLSSQRVCKEHSAP